MWGKHGRGVPWLDLLLRSVFHLMRLDKSSCDLLFLLFMLWISFLGLNNFRFKCDRSMQFFLTICFNHHCFCQSFFFVCFYYYLFLYSLLFILSMFAVNCFLPIHFFFSLFSFKLPFPWTLPLSRNTCMSFNLFSLIFLPVPFTISS